MSKARREKHKANRAAKRAREATITGPAEAIDEILAGPVARMVERGDAQIIEITETPDEGEQETKGTE